MWDGSGSGRRHDLEAVDDAQTKVTVFTTFAGHGLGKLLVGFARKVAARDADAFAQRIKAAAEAVADSAA